jgi:hypothetical protein
VQLRVVGELRWTSPQLTVDEGEVGESRLILSMAARWWWRTTTSVGAPRVNDKVRGEVKKLRKHRGLLREARMDKWLTGSDESTAAVAASLCMKNGGKVEFQLTWWVSGDEAFTGSERGWVRPRLVQCRGEMGGRSGCWR